MMDENHYVYMGEGDPPEDATHVSIHESITVIPEELFQEHPNIVELICHDGVKKIEGHAFYRCPRLKRAVMPGVEEVEGYAFYDCDIEHIECKKLEIIGVDAFSVCQSLESIDLPSAWIVEEEAFDGCDALRYVKFGNNLERIEERAFRDTALERFTIPLKNNLFTDDDVFMGCEDFGLCLLEEAVLLETVDALLLDERRNDMIEEIYSIGLILPEADAHGEQKATVIRGWIERVLQKIIRYKVEHYRLLSLAAAALAHVSPNEIVINSTLSFLQLPDHAFEGEGVDSFTTPTFDQHLWENIVQMEQRVIEMEGDLNEKDSRIRELELQVNQLKQQDADANDSARIEGAFEPSKNKRQKAN